MNIKTNRNSSMNVVKSIACFNVILLHVPFPGIVGKVLYGFARFAVPFFFMISGYFVYDKDYTQIKRKLPKKIKHICMYFLVAESLYFIWHICGNVMCGGIQKAFEWLKGTFTLYNFVRIILFQTTMIGDVSWFLLALILCYASVYIVGKQNIWGKMVGISILLLICNIFIGEILPLFVDYKIQWFYNSNFLLLGCPFFYIGASIRWHLLKLDKIKLLFILLFGIILVLIERIFTSASQFFFGNFFMAYSSFVLVIRYPQKFNNSWLEDIGEKYTFGIYILHPIIRDICRYLFPQTIIYLWIRPFVVFVGSLLVIWIYIKIKKAIIKRINKCFIS